MVGNWKNQRTEDLFYFRPRTSPHQQHEFLNSDNIGRNDEILDNVKNRDPISVDKVKDNMLFVHVSRKQIHLWKRYGSTIYLDSTYRTCKYAIPLFLLAVKTNVGYTSVGMFSCQAEDSTSIAEALKMIKDYICHFNVVVKNFMTDNCRAEIDAIKQVFPGFFYFFLFSLPFIP